MSAAPLGRRLWIYQAERFPVFRHGLLIAAFGGSAPCLSALLRGPSAFPSVQSILVSIACLFLFFLQLRIADEHKDAEDDRRYRPERPVPRGLVSLRELRRVGYFAAAAQAVLVLSFHPPLLVSLVLVWAWMALMTAEFFVGGWLRARPLTYMASHMAVMPLIDLFATATDWLPQGVKPSGAFGLALGAFLILSFANGAAIEIARKAWAPEDERPGVETYSSIWGPRRAGIACVGAILVSVLCAAFVHVGSGVSHVYLVLLLLAGAFAAAIALGYATRPTRVHAKRLEAASGLWVLASYVLLGVAPMGARLWMG